MSNTLQQFIRTWFGVFNQGNSPRNHLEVALLQRFDRYFLGLTTGVGHKLKNRTKTGAPDRSGSDNRDAEWL